MEKVAAVFGHKAENWELLLPRFAATCLAAPPDCVYSGCCANELAVSDTVRHRGDEETAGIQTNQTHTEMLTPIMQRSYLF